MKYLGFVLVLCLFAADAEAQLLRRNRVAQAGSSCPGGVCPVERSVAAPVATSVAPSRGHWSYPGDLDSHLEGTHGVSTAGMSRQQKLDLHDSLHEGTAPVVRKAPVTKRLGYQTVTVAKSAGSFGSSGGGSSGTFQVGGRDKDGAVITSISEPAGKPVYSVQPVVKSPSVVAPKATCDCGKNCQCNAGGGKCPCDDSASWSRPNLDFSEPVQILVRKEDFEQKPVI